MNILHINKFFDLHGGAEVYMHRLMAAESALGHDVHVFSTKSVKNLASRDERFFVTRYDLDRFDGPLTDAKKARNYLWNLEAKTSLEEYIRQCRPDVVHLHNLYHHLSTSALAPIRAARIPCVQTLHDYKLACPNYKMFTQGAPCERCKGGKYWNAIEHQCLTKALLPNVLAAMEMGMTKFRQSYERTVRLFFCPSHFLLEKMADWGEPPSKLRYLPNPTDFRPQVVPRGGGYVLFAGRLSEEKGLASFLEAACKIPELPIKIAGRGPEDERLRSLVRAKAATNVEFLGFQTPAAVADWRERAEAVVLPSIWYENSSLALLEAMGDGLPCLTTRIGGNPELVEDEVNGFLARPNDPQDWLRILRRFLALPSPARQRMAEAGRQKVLERHRWSDHVELTLSYYRQAIKP